jgi:hypothetical protein
MSGNGEEGEVAALATEKLQSIKVVRRPSGWDRRRQREQETGAAGYGILGK